VRESGHWGEREWTEDDREKRREERRHRHHGDKDPRRSLTPGGFRHLEGSDREVNSKRNRETYGIGTGYEIAVVMTIRQ
jgi:hypothetical protein